MKAHSVDSAAIRREPVANWRAGLQRANTVAIISISLALFLERPCVRFLSAPQPSPLPHVPSVR